MSHVIKLLFRTACVIIFCISCTPREKFAFFVRLDPGCESHRIAAGVISQRVKALYRKNTAELSGGQVKVTMYADQKLPVRLLLSKGGFYISETYTNAEILPLFVQVDDLLRKEQDTTVVNIDYPFFRLLQVIGRRSCRICSNQ